MDTFVRISVVKNAQPNVNFLSKKFCLVDIQQKWSAILIQKRLLSTASIPVRLYLLAVTCVQKHVVGVIKAVCMYPMHKSVPEYYFVDIHALVPVERTALHVPNSVSIYVRMDLVITSV